MQYFKYVKRVPVTIRLQISRIFCERERRGGFAGDISNERTGASVETAR